MSGPGPYGSGRRSQPHEVPDGRRQPQFGPDISWPNGFRQLEPEARRLLESGYGTPGYGRGQYDHVDPGYGAGARGSGYRQPDAYPSTDDYGDPGYSDPSYDGPRGGSGGRTWQGDNRGPRPPAVSDGPGYGTPPPQAAARPGYHVPDYREPARPEAGYQHGYPSSSVYPVTGAQEALPDTGPQPIAEGWSGRDPGSSRSGRQAYPEQWHDRPRLDDPRGSRSDGPTAGDPRLEGMRYDELRYDEPRYDEPRYDEPLAGGPGYDEPLDDESWVAELRRSAPAFPQAPGGQPGADQRRGDPRGSGYRQQPGYGSQPGPGQSSGGYPQAFGHGQGRDDRGGPGPATPRGPRMSAGPETGPRSAASPRDRGFADDPYSYSAAPTAQVGVLTPPAIRRLEDPSDTAPQPVAPFVAPSAAQSSSQVLAPQVRPGHGLDGPEITSSWPAQPQIDEQDSFEEFWAEDDDDAEFTGLFPGEDPDSGPRRGGDRTKGSGRRIGRRRGRNNDHRLWLALLGVLVVAAGAIFGILKLEFPSHSGPAHAMGTPPRIGNYVRTVDMERQAKLDQLKAEVIKLSHGQASNVVDAVYESGGSATGTTEQIVMFIGGHLANADPASSIGSFLQQFAGATEVPAGALGGKAACVEEAPGTSNSLATCVWFDNDSFGEIDSPTMKAAALANLMRTMRPSLEHLAPK